MDRPMAWQGLMFEGREPTASSPFVFTSLPDILLSMGSIRSDQLGASVLAGPGHLVIECPGGVQGPVGVPQQLPA